jgi:hypothetical protein
MQGKSRSVIYAGAFGGWPGIMEAALLRIWDAHFPGEVPLWASAEDLAGLFWIPTRSKRRGLYLNGNPSGGANDERRICTEGTMDVRNSMFLPPLDQGMSRWSGPGAHALRWEYCHSENVFKEMEHRHYYGGPGANRSGFITVPMRNGTDPTQRAIYVMPYGMDSMTVGWEDDRDYALQFVVDPRVGTSARFNEVTDPCSGGWNRALHSRIFYPFEWQVLSYNSQGNSIGDGRPEIRMRWRRKGTPFVGVLSRACMKDIQKAGVPSAWRYGWILE